MQKKFVCLAKSARDGGFCIAGKEIDKNGNIGDWFRPVGRDVESLSASDCTFDIGHIVTCKVSNHAPSSTQSENYKIAQQPNWQTVAIFPKPNIASLLDSPQSLWSTDFDSSSYHGVNDKVSQASATGNSLYFIKIAGGTITKQDQSYEGKQSIKLRLAFSYNDERYSLIVTCPDLSDNYWNKIQVGESEEIGPCYITVSLAQPFNGYCYKLVAGYAPI